MPLAKWGRMEEPEEFRQRIRLELTQCRDALVQNGGIPSAPGLALGEKYSPEALKIGKELGFELFFATSMGANPPGATDHIHRFKAKPKPPDLDGPAPGTSTPGAWLARLYAKVRI